MERFMMRPQARTAHLYDPLDSRMPMRAKCGHKEYPQDMIDAASCAANSSRPYRMDDPAYCPKCLQA